MRTRRKFLPLFYLSFILFIAVILFIYFVDPDKNLLIIDLYVPPVTFLFTIIFLAIFCLFSFIFLSKKRGVLSGIFILSFLILRLLRIENNYFLILIAIILVLADFYYKKEIKVKQANFTNLKTKNF